MKKIVSLLICFLSLMVCKAQKPIPSENQIILSTNECAKYLQVIDSTDAKIRLLPEGYTRGMYTSMQNKIMTNGKDIHGQLYQLSIERNVWPTRDSVSILKVSIYDKSQTKYSLIQTVNFSYDHKTGVGTITYWTSMQHPTDKPVLKEKFDKLMANLDQFL